MITGEMRVADVSALVPDAQSVLATYGIHCAGCSIGGAETLAEGCRLHGFGEDDIVLLLEDLNALLKETPKKPATLILTPAAAKALKDVRKGKNGAEEELLVTTDGQGGFCMEFLKEIPSGTRAFHHREEPDVQIYALPLTLRRIGGSVIDFREGRFKLDLAGE